MAVNWVKITVGSLHPRTDYPPSGAAVLTLVNSRVRHPGMLEVGKPLEVHVGRNDAGGLRICHSGGECQAGDSLVATWTWAGVRTSAYDSLRVFLLEPADGDNEIQFHGFYVRGGFKIVKRVNSNIAAKHAFRELQAAMREGRLPNL